MEKDLDIDVEMFSPEQAEARYRAKGLEGEELAAQLRIAALIYSRPKEEIREAVKNCRAKGVAIL